MPPLGIVANGNRRKARPTTITLGVCRPSAQTATVTHNGIALGEAKELIVALDCVEIDQLADTAEIVAAQDLADRVSAMLTKLIRSV